MDRTLAEAIATELRKLSEPINRLSRLSTDLESSLAKSMRQHLGQIMFEVEDIWQPIIREFPNLDPNY